MAFSNSSIPLRERSTFKGEVAEVCVCAPKTAFFKPSTAELTKSTLSAMFNGGAAVGFAAVSESVSRGGACFVAEVSIDVVVENAPFTGADPLSFDSIALRSEATDCFSGYSITDRFGSAAIAASSGVN